MDECNLQTVIGLSYSQGGYREESQTRWCEQKGRYFGLGKLSGINKIKYYQVNIDTTLVYIDVISSKSHSD